MALFGPETERIIRTKWKSVDEFAQELYALFNGKIDIVQEGKLTLKPDAAQQDAPLTIQFPDEPGGPAISINNGGVVQTFGGNPTDDGLVLGGITFNPTEVDPSVPDVGPQPPGDEAPVGGIDLNKVQFAATPPADSVPPPTLNPFPLYGEVQEKVTGSTYRVKCWAKDPVTFQPMATLEVLFPGVSTNDTIDPDTPCQVLCFPGIDDNLKLVIKRAVSTVPMFLPGV